MTASTALSILSALLAIVRWWLGYMQRRRWIEAERTQAILDGMRAADDAIAQARAARDAVRARHARDPAAVMHDDEFRRKE